MKNGAGAVYHGDMKTMVPGDVVCLEWWVRRPVAVWRDWRRLDEDETPVGGEVGLLLGAAPGGSGSAGWVRVVIGDVVGWMPMGWVRAVAP